MNTKDRLRIAEHLSFLAPYHLGGFFNGWLEIVEPEDKDFQIFHIYSNENNIRELITTYVRRK